MEVETWEQTNTGSGKHLKYIRVCIIHVLYVHSVYVSEIYTYINNIQCMWMLSMLYVICIMYAYVYHIYMIMHRRIGAVVIELNLYSSFI